MQNKANHLKNRIGIAGIGGMLSLIAACGGASSPPSLTSRSLPPDPVNLLPDHDFYISEFHMNKRNSESELRITFNSYDGYYHKDVSATLGEYTGTGGDLIEESDFKGAQFFLSDYGIALDEINPGVYNIAVYSDLFEPSGAIYVLWDVSKTSGRVGFTPSLITASSNYGFGKPGHYDLMNPHFIEVNGDEPAIGVFNQSELLYIKHGESYDSKSNVGAVVLIWDMTPDWYNFKQDNHLTVYGEEQNDRLGSNGAGIYSLFNSDSKDMIIGSQFAEDGKGAIYIVWDIDRYAPDNYNINLAASHTNNDFATHGFATFIGVDQGRNKLIDEFGEMHIVHADDDSDSDLLVKGNYENQHGVFSFTTYFFWDVKQHKNSADNIYTNNLDIDVFSKIRISLQTQRDALDAYKAINVLLDKDNGLVDFNGDNIKDFAFSDEDDGMRLDNKTYVLFGTANNNGGFETDYDFRGGTWIDRGGYSDARGSQVIENRAVARIFNESFESAEDLLYGWG